MDRYSEMGNADDEFLGRGDEDRLRRSGSQIKEGRYGDAIHILSKEHQKHTKSRAALSLLGFCYYHMQDFTNAAECYEQLTQLHPEVEDYKLYYAQSLYGACAFPEAMKATFLLDSTTNHTKMIKLQAAIKYGEEDFAGAKTLVEQLPQEDPDYDVDLGCLLYKEGEYEEACKKFMSSMNVLGYQPDLAYNIALCNYSLKQYPAALKYIAEIIERGIREHPELSIGMTTEGIDVRSVGNTLVLHETALIEAFNLKSAIENQLKNYAAAQEALTDMPPRSEEELDPVTLHNQALMNMDTKPTEGFEKLAFLLQQNPFPPVTFGNLLLLYCKYEYFDLAADVLAENAHLTYKFLTPVQESRHNREDDSLKKNIQEYDEVLERYIPVLMAQAKIYWNRENYSTVEKIFHKSLEFCNDNDTWKLNVAHVLFMQDNKYKEAIGFYEPIVKRHYDNAEELMRKIEKEEEQISYDDPDKKIFHLCIVNLVIGTLYCAKGNYDFGISRVIKSLEPYNKKLGTDTWFYAKRCFLSLLENMAKHMIMLRDSVVQECIQFLEHCELYGKDVPAIIEQPLDEDRMHIGKNTVTYESRLIKALFYEVTGWNE
ncbi:Tetratricopeptide repeat protein 30A [Triplophysa tibetana]|uniref:Tetratricopeptide repeat protein 30 n=1 Tax=Triplophysa tibetana TaxID=1572043 RepID=A0A5A9N9Q3_9TELE|nr:Tetratricopeptide repeat protein 30A [Triplophysa tibetana]